MSQRPIYPQTFIWDGEHMTPLNGRHADRQYVVGEHYRLAPFEDRSANSHNHYFASLAEAHANLPEDVAERFPTVEHMRKWALIKAGFRDERSIVCTSKAEALRVQSFIKPMDDYAVVLASDCVVKVFTATSQSVRAMGKADFQKSKQAVLDIVAGLIGVRATTLLDNAGKAA